MPEDDERECWHHPGVPIFHEGMKYWSCCQKKTSDFQAFLAQAGCTLGKCKWRKERAVTVSYYFLRLRRWHEQALLEQGDDGLVAERVVNKRLLGQGQLVVRQQLEVAQHVHREGLVLFRASLRHAQPERRCKKAYWSFSLLICYGT